MATEKDPKQSIDASSTKRKGKEIVDQVSKKNKDEVLAAGMKDTPDPSILIESSSDSEVEDNDEGLDVWEREAKRMFPPREAATGWGTWTTVEKAIIEVEYLASMVNFVPFTGELTEEELGPEVIFDMHYNEEEDDEAAPTDEVDPEQQTTEQGKDELDSALQPQEPSSIDQVAPSANSAAMADAFKVAADPSSSSFPPTD